VGTSKCKFKIAKKEEHAKFIRIQH